MRIYFAPFPPTADGGTLLGPQYAGTTPSDEARQQALASAGFLSLADAGLSVNKPPLVIQRAIALGLVRATFIPDRAGELPLTGRFVLRAEDWSDYVGRGAWGLAPPAAIGPDGWYLEGPKFYSSQRYFSSTLPNAAEADIRSPAEILRGAGDLGASKVGGAVQSVEIAGRWAGDRGLRTALQQPTADGPAGLIYLALEIRNRAKAGLRNGKFGSSDKNSGAVYALAGLSWLFGVPGRAREVFRQVTAAMMNVPAFKFSKTVVVPPPARFGTIQPDVKQDIPGTATVYFQRTFGELFALAGGLDAIRDRTF